MLIEPDDHPKSKIEKNGKKAVKPQKIKPQLSQVEKTKAPSTPDTPPKKNGKHPGGRPRKTVKNCMPKGWEEMILELSAEGCSETEIRAKLCLAGGKFNHGTWYALKEREEEFLEVLVKGKLLARAWWEEQARTRLYHTGFERFETALWHINMKNRFGWKDTDEEGSKFAELNSLVSLIKLAHLKNGNKNGSSRLPQLQN